ncbi:MAG: hypothetical protein ACPK85_06385, partial [Methanosarcina sp.]
EEMGLAARLGKKPRIIGNAAIYGIDSVPKSKIPAFDYSGFEVPDSILVSESESSVNYRRLLVMHQIVQPFPYAEWNCSVVLENLPFEVDAILLGDYHKYEKFKVGEKTWATYPGSTERNSASEEESRSYNIITLSGDGVEISKRTIPTRNFFSIPVELNGEENPHEQVFSKINERLEELPESVVSIIISGDSKTVLSFSEIEEYLLNKGALVPRVKDLRIKETLPEEVLKVTFSDPDQAVATEIKRMNLNDGGLIIDEIIRNPHVLKSRVDEETENRLSRLIEAIDFKDPDFRAASINAGYAGELSEALNSLPERSVSVLSTPESSIFMSEHNSQQKDYESEPPSVSELNSGLESKSKFNTELKSRSEPVPKSQSEPKLEPRLKSEFESRPVFESKDKSKSSIRPSKEASSGPKSNTGFESEEIPSYGTGFALKSSLNPAYTSGPEFTPETPAESISFQETSENLVANLEKKADTIEKAENRVQKEIEALKEAQERSGDEKKLQNIEPGKIEKAKGKIEEEAAKSIEISGKKAKTGQKKEKAKPAAPRQYNLGDYL